MFLLFFKATIFLDFIVEDPCPGHELIPGKAQMTTIRPTRGVLGGHCVSSDEADRMRRIKVSPIMNGTYLFSHRYSTSKLKQTPPVSQLEVSRTALLQYDQVRTDKLCNKYQSAFGIKFGPYVAREALFEEEYWTAAWLRANSHCEDRSSERYIDSYKRKFAEQEFIALKRRCSETNHLKSCTCIVVVKVEVSSEKRQSVASVVGTLDISVQHPKERKNILNFGTMWPALIPRISRAEEHIYAYVSNLCVAKSERRKGIATNMLCLAIETAQTQGAEEIHVHVHGHNKAAKLLYQSIGFQMVEKPPNPFLLAAESHLLSYKVH